ncbi:MAG: hypothetical protein KGH53_01080 [Candidatus Micrarchaeota archaeon]|nr:hypothetical protein [Candidatus Micrarchaeota archaeon]
MSAEEDAAKSAMSKRLQAQQIEQQKREILRRYLTDGAFERIANVRMASPDMYGRFVDLVVSLVRANRLQGKLSEEQLKELLARLASTKEEPKIEFRHK